MPTLPETEMPLSVLSLGRCSVLRLLLSTNGAAPLVDEVAVIVEAWPANYCN